MPQKHRDPKVSVCVITYNQEKYIRECLQSIVDQVTDFEFEVIVGDDCSTDGTKFIIEEFVSKYPTLIRPIYQEKNIGGGVNNFLTVHKHAKGDYVAQIDGDDLMLFGKLQKQAEFLDMHSSCTVVWHRVNCFNDEEGFVSGEEFDYSMIPNGVVTFSAGLRYGSLASSSSTMYRRMARRTIEPEFPFLDLFYSWEYLSVGWGKVLDEVLGEYRMGVSNSISKRRTRFIRFLNFHHAEYFLEKYPEHRKDIFIFALSNLLVDLNNLRLTSRYFFLLCVKSVTFVSPIEFASHIRQYLKLRSPNL